MASEAHVHRYVFEDPWGRPTSVGVCACGATTEARNRLSRQEADRLLGLTKGKIKEDKPMAVSSSPPAAAPSNGSHPALPLELSMNDFYISSFGFKVAPEYQAQPIDRIEFSGDPAEIKRLQEKIKAGSVVVTLKFKNT